MAHSDLITTLTAALVAAFIGGFIAAKLGMPPLIGFLVAGVAIGPYTPGGSANSAVTSELAEVGVILLMFGVGLHFSPKDLLSVRGIAVPGALVQLTIATLLGMGLSQWWGWSAVEGLILGLCLSVASTVVLLTALEARGELEGISGRVAVGWLVVEDLFTVVVLVLLPAFTSGGADHGLARHVAGDYTVLLVVLSLLQAGVFVALMLFVGVKAIPRLLSEVERTHSRELFTLSVLAIAMGVAVSSAELFGASLALGAFLAGAVLNESELSHRAGLEALPLRDAFGVLFFVSVGMLFEPSILVDAPMKVLGVVAIVVVGKALAAFAIVALLGQGLRTGLTVATGLAQVGEFSFILSALAVRLDVFPSEGSSLILAAALISITLNAFLFRKLDGVDAALVRMGRLAGFANRNLVPVEAEAA